MADFNIASTIDSAFTSVSGSLNTTVGRTQVVASAIFGLMLFLEVLTIFIMYLVGKDSVTGVLSSADWKKRLFSYLMWYALFIGFPLVMPMTRKVLTWLGFVLAGQPISDQLVGPGAFLSQCMLSIKPLWISMTAEGQSVPNVLVNLVSILFVTGAFIQLVLIYIANTLSFGIVIALGLYFIPLGVLNITEQFSEYYIQCLISFGFRYVITIFMVEMTFGLFSSSLSRFNLTKIEDCCAVVVLIVAYNMAVNIIPNTAKDIASGSVTNYRLTSLAGNVASEMAFSAVMGKLMSVAKGAK